MKRQGLVLGTAGNISVRVADGLLVTPTGVPYEDLVPEQIVAMKWDGTFHGDVLPTSEWRFHRDILASRKDLNAVVHTHSRHATAVAILNRDIPPLHYTIAAAGGADIRCAGYATFGTQDLSDLALEALRDRRACLLAHHGVIAAHATLDKALALAQTVEELAALYLMCLDAREVPVLQQDNIDTVLAKYVTYGQQKPA
ncbi:class II aldolase/adducin family protein [Defluviimonas sp. SAOS-178_SWC]|uniref:class II aldolase/adducin family protein n=1 Tax=Defluviimonas sp. SAOS-178_SWC TaxID=3121287 RepID=UPI0032219E7B